MSSLIKNVAYAVIPFHSDVKRGRDNAIDGMERKFVNTKRVIAGGLALTTIALAVLMTLALTGVLPTSSLGGILLIAGTGTAFAATASYILGLGIGRLRSIKINKETP